MQLIYIWHCYPIILLNDLINSCTLLIVLMTSCLLYSQSCCCSVTESCPTLCDPMNCSTPGFPVLHCLPEFTQIYVHWVSDAIQPSYPLSPSSPALNLSQHHLSHPTHHWYLLSLISGSFPISWLCIRWPKYWSFSFSISPSSEHLGLISFRFDWFDLLAIHGTLKNLLQHHN